MLGPGAHGTRGARSLAVAILLGLGACARDELPEPAPPELPRDLASRLAAFPLSCLEREYPNKPGNIVEDEGQVLSPRRLTPVFFGCFDWHSSVHGHWTLVRLLRLYPDLAAAPRIRALLDRHLAAGPLLVELEYLRARRNATFERPYGWGWLLRLAAEAAQLQTAPGRRWSAALAPLARFVGQSFIGYLGRLSRPVREGTHGSTAFAMVHALDYARVAGDRHLAGVLERRARELFEADRGCPAAFEPSGEDFISPCLVEADLLRRVLQPRPFAVWLDSFLPAIGSPLFRSLGAPPEVRDLKDYRIGHLIGLGLQRAASFDGIAEGLPAGDPRRAAFRKLAADHQRVALGQLEASGYGGAHWLASFVVYHLSRAGLGLPR